MDRKVSDRTILDEFAEKFCEIAEKYVKYIICSGFVSIAHGRSRGTEDIDMIIERIPIEIFINLHKNLEKAGFECMQSDNPKIIYEEYLMNGDSIRYTFGEGGIPPEMEVKFAKDILDEEQLKTRKKLPFTGLDIYFSSIESNIAFKEELLKSDKDIEDARHLRIIYKEEINEEIINKIKRNIRILRLKKNER